MGQGITSSTLANLPAPGVIAEISIPEILKAMRDRLVALFPDIVGVIDLETELSRMVLEVCSYREGLIRGDINDAVRANLLAFAQSGDLEHLAAFYDVVRMVDETDDRLRKRIVLGIRGRSPGGTSARYEFITLSSDIRVSDAHAWVYKTDPLVNIAVFSTDTDGIADAALLTTVRNAIEMPDARLVNDRFNVVSAVTQTIDIEADIWLLPDAPATLLTSLPSVLTDAHSIENGLGFDLTVSWLSARLMQPGVQRVVMKSPAADVVVSPTTAVALGTITLTDMGRDY